MTGQDDIHSMLADFYSRHVTELRVYIYKCIGDMAEAEDIVQDVFLKILSSGQLVYSQTLSSLVYTMARNMVNDRCRHRGCVERYEHYIKQSGGVVSNETPMSVYSCSHLQEILEKGMSRLSYKQRTVYYMNVIEGKKISQITDELGENYKTIENRLGTARKNVRSYVEYMLEAI